MGVTRQMKTMIYIVWIFLVPVGMVYTYRTYPPHLSGQWLDLLAFFLLSSVVASMPMVINNTPIFLIQWVSLATFLQFGLFVEMVFAQLAVITLLLKLRIQKDQFFRLPMNMNMFIIVSFVSGSIYYLLGGHTGVNLTNDYRSLGLAALYAVLNYTLNQIIVSFHLYVVYKAKESYFGKDFVVETITTLITFPIGFILYMLYNQEGLLSILFVGVPFVGLSIIFRLYYSSEKINGYLQQAAEIGHQMAERLQVQGVIDLFIQRLNEMLPVDYAFLETIEEDHLKLIRRIEDCEVLPVEEMPRLKKNEGISGLVWAKGKAMLFSTRKEWKSVNTGYIPINVESILSVPIVTNKKVIGVLLLASKRKRAYEKSQLMITDILCSSFAVALENARHYEITKMQSERCSLTKLYNYRYFENLLTEEFNKLFQFERQCLSLILLDIDHFKSVNDTYGHQSGNEILVELAGRLTKMVNGRGTVARYGGEEFVVLLPEMDKGEAYETAEHIRQSIANWPFTLYQALHQENVPVQVKITASIGVATAPMDAEDALALIRHADRALYVGAKRAGRNRVAEYSTC